MICQNLSILRRSSSHEEPQLCHSEIPPGSLPFASLRSEDEKTVDRSHGTEAIGVYRGASRKQLHRACGKDRDACRLCRLLHTPLGTAEILHSIRRRRRIVNIISAAALFLLCVLVISYADRFKATKEALGNYAVITTCYKDEAGNWVPVGEEYTSTERPDERYRIRSVRVIKKTCIGGCSRAAHTVTVLNDKRKKQGAAA